VYFQAVAQQKFHFFLLVENEWVLDSRKCDCPTQDVPDVACQCLVSTVRGPPPALAR
jgi:hypothetical protein